MGKNEGLYDNFAVVISVNRCLQLWLVNQNITDVYIIITKTVNYSHMIFLCY